ncbi:hypothetical protein [Burkholderia pseudomallei]|uniref:hypothetical protein n=1 Tax=Burkholderia pseudomallei TaxID=28450 RepID=UPI00294A1A11|nr:hypothetical protein [Burkholderia pseudomallei]CAJ9609432.1 Uncharacterised protein [Burkholderia pseudomallei]
MESIVTTAAEYIARMKRTGLLQTVEDKADTEPSLIEERRNWAAELAGISHRRAKELPPLAKAAERAVAEEVAASEKAREALKARQEAQLRAFMAGAAIDGRENQLKLWLEGYSHPQQPGVDARPVPAILLYLRDVYGRIELMYSNLGHAVRATHERHEPTGWSGRLRLVEIYNSDEVFAARQKADALLDQVRSLMREPDLDPPTQRLRADKLLHIAEIEIEPLFKNSPIEDFYERQKLRLFGVRKTA